MRLRLVGERQEDLAAAADAIEELVRDMGGEVSVERASTTAPAAEVKSVDPVSVAALVLTIPSAILSVLNLVDRIRKRRRARKLIGKAGEIQATHDVEVLVVTETGTQPLESLDPDRLLELAAQPDDPPA